MTRKLIFVPALVVFAGLLGVSPYWMGVRAERTYDGVLRAASANGPVSFQIRAYDRGWFSSRARVAVTVRIPTGRLPAAPGAGVSTREITFNIAQRIDHGPFPFRDWRAAGWAPVQAVVHTALDLNPQTMSTLMRDAGGHPPLTMVTVVHLSGASDTRIGIPAFRMPIGAILPGTLAWKGLQGRVEMAGDFSRSTQDLTLVGVSFLGAAGAVKIGDVHLVGRGQRGASGLMLGSSTLHVGAFTVTNGRTGATPVVLRDVTLQSTSGESDGAVTLAVNSRVAHMTLGGVDVGPAEYDVTARDLDAAALVQFQTALQDLRSRRLTQKQLQLRLAEQFRILLPALLHRSPEVEIRRLSFKTPVGGVQGHGQVKFDATGYDAGAAGNGWLQHLQGSADLQIPPVLVRSLLAHQARAQLAVARQQGTLGEADDARLTMLAGLMAKQRMQGLEAQGLLRCTDARCDLALRYRNGTLSVNDHVIPLHPKR
ncbi:MAG: hypothetical protein B7Z66_07050 [Chromatiales bacterium 21-64-14]|nr:MAG: hypothetical protein B7Z66_07050 [Chromatiales bacterium 21-64-14]HQU16575.1 YdgA family protein [Gammaproteobacteria bacterium]